jgi:outer membrane protein OmpA-like peptidoglycan-associated protein
MASSARPGLHWTPVLLGTVGIAVLIFVGVNGGPDQYGAPAKLRADTEAVARAALRDHGHDWARFEVRPDGVGVLSGEAPAPEVQQAAQAAVQAALAGRIGFPGVVHRLSVADPIATPVRVQGTPASEQAPREAATPAAPEPKPAAPNAAPAAQGDARACARAILAARAQRPIRFAVGATEPEAAAGPVLTDIARAIAVCPGVQVIVEGHTDDRGAAAANVALSQARAEAAVAALVAAGAPREALVARGLGETRPAAGSKEAFRNRRITFSVKPI